MKGNAGVTLIEILIAMVIMIIASTGFLIFETNMFRNSAAIERNNTAYAMARDVADRLQRMSDNSLILHKTGSTQKCVGFDSSSYVLKECLTGGAMDCNAGAPAGDISVGMSGLVTYTNPWNGSVLYLYDGNACENKTWVDAGCGSGVIITSAANSKIDHPNAAGSAYDSINPVRSFKDTTFYAVWSVAYTPCNTGSDTNKRNIFVTVYWIVPEPKDATVAAVQTKIANGTYSMKSVTITVDKAIGTES